MSLQKDEAVSPVIATILLVAIVVVLVAIVAAVVLPMAGNMETTKSVSVAVKLNETGQSPVVTILGGQDAATLKNLTVYVSGTNETVIHETKVTIGKPYTTRLPKLNETGRQTVNVVGEFDDGAIQTLYSTTMTFQE